jgi:hypothetical protein
LILLCCQQGLCSDQISTIPYEQSEGVHHQPCPRPRVRSPPSQAIAPAIPGALLPAPAQATPPAIPGAVMPATRASHTAPIPRRPRFPRVSPAPPVIPPIHHAVMPRAVISTVGFPEVSTPAPPPAGYPAHTKPRPCARPRRHSRRPIPYLAATACHPAPPPPARRDDRRGVSRPRRVSRPHQTAPLRAPSTALRAPYSIPGSDDY